MSYLCSAARCLPPAALRGPRCLAGSRAANRPQPALLCQHSRFTAVRAAHGDPKKGHHARAARQCYQVQASMNNRKSMCNAGNDHGHGRLMLLSLCRLSSSSAVWQRAFQRSMCAIQIAQHKVLYEVRISLLKTFKQTHARCPGGIALSHRRPLLWPEERSIKNLHNIVQC